jgi:hypothetical protein
MSRQRLQGPRVGRSQGLGDSRPPEIISGADMDAAILAGEGVAFSQVITFVRRYQHTWWLSTDAGWFQVRPSVAAVLEEHAERMGGSARRTAASHAAIRAVVELAREATKAIDSRPQKA